MYYVEVNLRYQKTGVFITLTNLGQGYFCYNALLNASLPEVSK